MQPHNIVTREEWIAARKAHLAHEKEYTRARDRLSAERRALPWVKVDKAYWFDGPNGKQTLADLFAGRSQLVVQHFMFAPDWSEGCKSCSFWADGFERIIPHLAARDTTLVAISRAPLPKLDAFKARMGWTFDWFSSDGNDFNYDYGVSFTSEQTKPVTPSDTTSGTEPRFRPITGVPHARASAITIPNGSSHRMGIKNALARPRSRFF